MNDLDRWAETSDDRLYEIAKDWADQFTLSQLKEFQRSYLGSVHKSKICNHIRGLQNMWQCATYAICIQECPDDENVLTF